MKRHSTQSILRLTSSFAACLALVACGPSDTQPIESTSTTNGLLLQSAPNDALSVGEARTQLSNGDLAVISGQIGGTTQPFVDGYAAFVLADPDILFCNEMGDDHCPTPWDACCEDPDKLRALRASIRFNDSEGNALPLDLKSSLGLKELDSVTVTGLVAETSTPENLVILANGIYVEPPAP